MIKIKLPPLRKWMPFAIGALCLGLGLLAIGILLADHFEPESPQSAVVTSPSAQGFMGIRRLLEARGYQTALNRYDDEDKAEKGDIEIITLDADSPLLYPVYREPDPPRKPEKAKASSSASSAATSGASSSASSGASSSSAASKPKPKVEMRRIDSSYEWQTPDFDKSVQILYKPNGRVVLLVAPKWTAAPVTKNIRWARDPSLIWPNQFANMAIVGTSVWMTPEESARMAAEQRAKDRSIVPIKPKPPAKSAKGKKPADDEDNWWSYEEPSDVVVTRDSEWRKPDTVQGALQGVQSERIVSDDEDEDQAEADPDAVRIVFDGHREFPLTHSLTLKPAPGQTLFTSELRFGPVAGLQGLSSTRLTPVLVGSKGEAILSRVDVKDGVPPKVPVYLLADPDLLNNQILSDPQKVATALAIIETITPKPKTGTAPRAVFDLTFNGMSYDRNIMHYLSRPPYVAMPIALFILTLVLIWTAFSRFGPAIETAKAAPMGRGVKVLADNAARLVGVAMRETRMGPLYAQMVRDAVLKGRTGQVQFGPEALGPDEMADRLGALYGATDSYLKLKADAQKTMSVHQLVDVALRLRAWKQDILHKTKPN